MTAEIDPVDAARAAGLVDRYRAAQALANAERAVLDQTLLDIARRSGVPVGVLGAAVGMHPNAVRAALQRATGPSTVDFDQPKLDLDRAVWEGIYEQQVRRDVFAGARPTAHPVGVIVGGQGGAGKTRAVRDARAEHDALTIPSDDLRPYFPDYDRLMREDPLAMPDATDAAMSLWRSMALEEAVRRRTSLVVENTLRRPGLAESFARALREGGFAVEVRVLGVPPVVSMLGVLSRYVGQVEHDGAGRWVAQADHDRAVQAIPGVVDRLVDQRLVDRLMVVARDGRALYDVRSPTDAHEFAEALGQAQDPASVTSVQASWWAGEYERCARFVAEHEQLRDVPDTTVRLGRSGLASIGWPDDASASQVRDAVDAVSGRDQPSPVRERLAALRSDLVDDLDAGDVRARLRDLAPRPAQDEPPVVGGPSGLQMWTSQKRRSS